MSVEMILKQGDKIVDKDTLSLKAAKDLIRGALEGLLGDKEKALEQVIEIIKLLMMGQTIEIKNEKANTSFIFQLKRVERRIN